MTAAPADAGKVVSLGGAGRTAPRPDTPGLAIVAWFARRLGRTALMPAVAARLPQGADLADPQMLGRALEAVGLKSRLVRRDPAALDPVVLPAVLFRKGAAPLILIASDRRRHIATVIDMAAGGIETEIPLRDLRRSLRPGILLVTQAEDRVASRLDPALRDATPKGHWFWAVVRANRAVWAQVLVAALCLNVLALALPLFVMNVYDRVIPNLAFVTLWTLAIGVALALGLELLLRSLRVALIERVGQRVDLKVAATLFRQAMNVRLLDRPGGAAAIANTIRDFETVRDFFTSASVVAVIDLLFIGVFIGVLYLIVGPLALVPLLAVPVVLVLALVAQAPLGRSAAQAQGIGTRRQVVLIEALSSVETVKSLGAEPAMQREWENAVAASARIGGRTRVWSNLATNGTMLVQQAVSVILIVWGVFLVAEGRITIGGLIAANILAGRVLAPLGAIAQTIFRAQYAFRALGALNAFMRLPSDSGPAVTSDLEVAKGALDLRQVTMTYPGQQTPVLKDFSLSVGSGELVALLGRVGAGKTTLGKLATGLIQPDSGTVLIDGVTLAQYDPASLRRGVGYLPQEPHVFTGTLRENLALGAPDATDAQMRDALAMAGMEPFVTALSTGLDTFVGERGMRLSGGQRQGLALARLILRAPKLLILDEPSSAMDQRMEADIARHLTALNAAGTGLILCTHRPSLAAIAKRIVVIDEGRVVLDGSAKDVLARLSDRQTPKDKD